MIKKLLVLLFFGISSAFYSYGAAAAPAQLQVSDLQDMMSNLSAEDEQMILEQQRYFMDLAQRVETNQATNEEIQMFNEIMAFTEEMYNSLSEDDQKALLEVGEQFNQKLEYSDALEHEQFASAPVRSNEEEVVQPQKPAVKDAQKQALELIRKINKHIDAMIIKIESDKLLQSDYASWKEREEFLKLKKHLKTLETKEYITKFIQHKDHEDTLKILHNLHDRLFAEHQKFAKDNEFGLSDKQKQDVLGKLFASVKDIMVSAIDDVLPFLEKFFEEKDPEKEKLKQQNAQGVKKAQLHEKVSHQPAVGGARGTFTLQDPARQPGNSNRIGGQPALYSDMPDDFYYDDFADYKPQRRHQPGKPLDTPGKQSPAQSASPVTSQNTDTPEKDATSVAKTLQTIQTSVQNYLKSAAQSVKDLVTGFFDDAKIKSGTLHTSMGLLADPSRVINESQAKAALDAARVAHTGLQSQVRVIESYMQEAESTVEQVNKKMSKVDDYSALMKELKKVNEIRSLYEHAQELTRKAQEYMRDNEALFATSHVNTHIPEAQKPAYQQLHQEYQELYGLPEKLENLGVALDIVYKKIDTFTEIKEKKRS